MKKPGIIFVLLLLQPVLHASTFRTGSFTYLKGERFKVEPEKQQTLTFEYVMANPWGDLFLFIDDKDFENGGSSHYGEFSPRVKLIDFANGGLFDKLFLASTLEQGKGGNRSYLLGLGVNMNVPGFRYFKTNIYQRNNPDRPGKGYQITTAWAYPFNLGEMPLLIDGYFDWTFSNQESNKNFHFNPQIKIDMKQWTGTESQWFIGIEYDYWDHKFGIKDSAEFNTRQNTYSFLLKWHF